MYSRSIASSLPKSATGLHIAPESQLDLRPESDIVSELCSFRSVTSEKNVWAFWDKGLDSMYTSYRCTVLNWVRKLGPSWTVRVVDLVEGSPKNVYNYVGRDWFPDCFVNRTMGGFPRGAKLRGPCASTAAVRARRPARSGTRRGSFGNYMLAARKGCVFIGNWHKGYKEFWKGGTNVDGFHKLPLVQDIGLAEDMADWNF
ncbi:hypothetical protein DL766_007467 [Monosporascus sp. MC13-8B]|uniref:Uncharacterized protein n=1 Tax=Monosporascus cannonballus TaxID=155416 RepID=A0ABY0GTF7_9PEZI|nr:hypothetical protein DL762_009581 [Monosporascus cannonballus]RYO82042.1 hypothetical protein DL763_008374 [Monosporascus cannonballus]RYP23758.1 hypothetical protein DL766_007467 [Monosporascus sp. MC13-8B]